MTAILASLALLALGFAAGWKAATSLKIGDREADRRERLFWENPSLTVDPEGASR